MRKCIQCGKDIESLPTKAVFCSGACRSKSHRGKSPIIVTEKVDTVSKDDTLTPVSVTTVTKKSHDVDRWHYWQCDGCEALKH